jgi:hypothetical protein
VRSASSSSIRPSSSKNLVSDSNSWYKSRVSFRSTTKEDTPLPAAVKAPGGAPATEPPSAPTAATGGVAGADLRQGQPSGRRALTGADDDAL